MKLFSRAGMPTGLPAFLLHASSKRKHSTSPMRSSRNGGRVPSSWILLSPVRELNPICSLPTQGVARPALCAYPRSVTNLWTHDIFPITAFMGRLAVGLCWPRSSLHGSSSLDILSTFLAASSCTNVSAYLNHRLSALLHALAVRHASLRRLQQIALHRPSLA